MENGANAINRRESAALLNSLTAGVVPRIGLRHIAVGRQNETEAILRDLETIEAGGASFRMVCGQYGSGKSFLLQMIRGYAMEKGYVVADADLSPERRLTGSKGQGLATYRELLQHLSTLVRPEGSALEAILQRWIMGLQTQVMKEAEDKLTEPQLVDAVSEKISEVMEDLSEMAYGFAFSSVIDAYWCGMKTCDDQLKQSALRWLRGEYATKTEARADLAVDSVIDDQSWYDFLKLFARFVSRMAYKGLLIFLDEGVNLYKINQRQARENNYEKLLTIFNDTMQGKAGYIGFFISGTPQFVYDERRGLFSYDALRSRLTANRFEEKGYVDHSGPVIRLEQLSAEEIYLLLERLCMVHSAHYHYEQTLGPDELTAFMNAVTSRIGTERLLTPREITRDFLGLLNILQQHPEVSFKDLVDTASFEIAPAENDPEALPEASAEEAGEAAQEPGQEKPQEPGQDNPQASEQETPQESEEETTQEKPQEPEEETPQASEQDAEKETKKEDGDGDGAGTAGTSIDDLFKEFDI